RGRATAAPDESQCPRTLVLESPSSGDVLSSLGNTEFECPPPSERGGCRRVQAVEGDRCRRTCVGCCRFVACERTRCHADTARGNRRVVALSVSVLQDRAL